MAGQRARSLSRAVFLKHSGDLLCMQGMPSLDSFARDLHHAARRLARERAFTVTSVLTLALCLAANVVIFTVVHSVLLRPLPFARPDELVVIYNRYPKANVPRAGAAVANYYDRKGKLPALVDLALTQGDSGIVGEAGSPQRVRLQRATPSFWPLLGVQPALGRFWSEEENEYGRNDVVVLTDNYWRARFGGNPDVIGQTMRLNELPTTIIGVLPAGFRYLSSDAQLWIPLPSSPDQRLPNARHNNNQEMIGRLRPGATEMEAQAQMDALNAQLTGTDPFAAMVADAGFGTTVENLHAEHVSRIRTPLVLLQVGALFLLLIGAVNLVNLLLIRASARTKELAVRRVLGASGARVVLQVVSETLLLALAGGLLGLGLGAVGLRALGWFGADTLPLGAAISMDWSTAGILLAGSALVGLLLAVPVIWFNVHGHLAPLLNSESRSGTTTRATHRLRHALIVVQVGITFMLLAGAGLLGLSFRRVLATDPGFQPDNLIAGVVALPWTNYREDGQRLAFAERLLTELRALPGVKAASVSTGVPFGRSFNRSALFVEGHTPAPGDSLHAHSTYGVTGDFFQTVGIPLLEGRFLTDADNRSDTFACVVDEDVARLYWPGSSALGRRVFNGPPEIPGVAAATVVGVVGRVKERDLGDPDRPGAVYFSNRVDRSPLTMFVAVRTVQPAETAAPAMREAVLRIDPGLPLDDLHTMQERMRESLSDRRSPMLLAAIFAVVALVLAGIGIYGVLAYAVAQRRREIGVRMALGAQPRQILRQFLVLGGWLLGLGSALGVVAACLVGWSMRSLLFGVAFADPLALGLTAVLITAVGLTACLLPSRRAARVHPMEALRSD